MTILSAMSQALFGAFVLMTIMGAFLAVRRSVMIMHSVLGLAVCMLGIAGLYYFLGSMFMSMMQVLIYIGALCVVLVFGIMVSYTPAEIKRRYITGKHMPLALAAGFFAVVPMGVMVFNADFQVNKGIPSGDIAPLGKMLLYKYCMAFELISMILLIAIVGSIILSKGGHVGGDESEEGGDHAQ
ncbi:MAG: NADH-quinone oxidoreductase subunit J [Desulfobacter sp.]